MPQAVLMILPVQELSRLQLCQDPAKIGDRGHGEVEWKGMVSTTKVITHRDNV